jgi:hypothetical protein
MEEKTPTRSQRRAASIIPWIDLVVAVGDQVTSHEIISRLCDPDSVVRKDGPVYRNMKHIPHVNAFAYIMGCCSRYKKIKLNGRLSWKRIE